MKNLKKSKNIILVDTSYTLFHRYFATLRWLSLANNDLYKEHINDKDYNWQENPIFIEKYVLGQRPEWSLVKIALMRIPRKIYQGEI